MHTILDLTDLPDIIGAFIVEQRDISFNAKVFKEDIKDASQDGSFPFWIEKRIRIVVQVIDVAKIPNLNNHIVYSTILPNSAWIKSKEDFTEWFNSNKCRRLTGEELEILFEYMKNHNC